MKRFLLASLLLAAACLLTASAANPTPDLYRFSTLRIAKGTIIQTQDGPYIALDDERWVSGQQFMWQQKEIAYLQEQLAQANRRRMTGDVLSTTTPK